jgi:hypothetical protein
MKGDFSRDSFDRLKHFSRVLMQQGRVQLDADWNEQVSILLHYIQTLATDIIGPYAGPAGEDYGFEIKANGSNSNFTIGKGRYYVNGILCENEKEINFTDQPHKPAIPSGQSGDHIVYLDVWERHISFLEDDDIREKALGGPDTATRTKTVWQVKVKELNSTQDCLSGAGLLDNEIVISNACLCARAKTDQEQVEPCLVEPEARYRGAENQLYRVEIHDGSYNSQGNPPTTPTFKWSRENGSVVFPIKGIKPDEGYTVTLELENLGRDDRFGLAVNDWVEIEDDTYVLNNMARPLLQVQKVDRVEMTVTLEKKKNAENAYLDYYLEFDKDKHPLLRRWDQKKDVPDDKGVLNIEKSNSDLDGDWHELENGIKIKFKPGRTYRTGDYWLIPARTALGDVEWPEKEDTSGKLTPEFLPPHGVMHHLAPLAIISVTSEKVEVKYDCRCEFKPLSYDCSYSYYGQLGIGIGVDLLCPD